jgi:hypothetical protein
VPGVRTVSVMLVALGGTTPTRAQSWVASRRRVPACGRAQAVPLSLLSIQVWSRALLWIQTDSALTQLDGDGNEVKVFVLLNGFRGEHDVVRFVAGVTAEVLQGAIVTVNGQ